MPLLTYGAVRILLSVKCRQHMSRDVASKEWDQVKLQFERKSLPRTSRRTTGKPRLSANFSYWNPTGTESFLLAWNSYLFELQFLKSLVSVGIESLEGVLNILLRRTEGLEWYSFNEGWFTPRKSRTPLLEVLLFSRKSIDNPFVLV